MKNQPNRDYVSNDVVQTPPALALRIVEHFDPQGVVLEPCAGRGHFVDALLPQRKVKTVHDCEISAGKDFFDFHEPVDWIVTNPPWSQIRPFLQHSFKLADEVVFLMTVNHVWTKARLRDMKTAGFGLRQIALVEMPKEFPASGFQLGAVHFSRGWTGPMGLVEL